ncbi:MAG: cation:proton antiporter [Tunicatimonas sp.]
MELEYNPYIVVIAISVIIILSYLFNLVSRKTNVPSVLLLIILGIGIKQMAESFGLETGDLLFSVLEILGIVGLTMIVLEAALDLKLTKEKWPLIWKSFLVALVALIVTSLASAYIIQYYFIESFFTALVYAVPLSVISSAIVIPSVGALDEARKEFMVYEATFSDILGIMFFYFLLGNADTETTPAIVWNVVSNIALTLVLSVLVSYALVLLFQKLDTHVKLFLLIAVLLLLYSLGKLFHLSSLVIILVFGLILNNHRLFFFKPLSKLVDSRAVSSILNNFHLVTLETAFVMRTFFFVVFGMTIVLATLFDADTAVVSGILLVVLYAVRWLMLLIFVRKDILPQLFIAPRGLITVLLFFSIPDELFSPNFNSGVLLFMIIISSVVMTLSLVLGGTQIRPYEEFANNYWDEVDKEIDKIDTKEKAAIAEKTDKPSEVL